MSIRLASLLALLLAAASSNGCMSAAQLAASTKNEAWIRSQPVLVRLATSDEAVMVGASGSMKGFGKQIARGIAMALHEYYNVNATVLENGEPIPSGIIVELSVDGLFIGDSRSQLMVSFEMPASQEVQCRASGKVIAEGRVVGEIASEQSASMGMFESDYLELLDECGTSVSEDIADQIVTGQYRSVE